MKRNHYCFNPLLTALSSSPRRGLVLAILMLIFQPGSAEGQLERPALAPATSGADKVNIELVAQYETAQVGQKFALAVVLDIPEGWHLYANPKRGELGLDTEIIPKKTAGLHFGKAIYPEGKYYEDKILEASNYIYEGRQICYVPVEVLRPGTEAAIPIRLQLKGLLCSDAGSCVPWQEQATGVIEVSSEISKATKRTDLFAGFDIDMVDWGTQTTSVPDVPRVPMATTQTGSDKIVMPDYQPREFSEVSLTARDWIRPILLALIAGVLLNLMPCVLPVIPLKVLSLIQQAQADMESGDKYKAVKLSVVFSIGIVLVFVALAVVMSVFKILYGQQFQSNAFKFVTMVIIYVLGLSMLGLFEVVLPGRITNINIVKEGYAGALGMGVLATLLATPCSAPLLGPVLTWSLSKPTVVTVAVFIVVGIGMAAPYVTLTAFPQLLSRIPKAGNWMIRLKQGLGFVMLAVTAYLIFLFEPGWHLPLVMFCLAVALALWLGLQVVNATSKPLRRRTARLAAIFIVIITAVGLIRAQPEQTTDSQNTENWLVAQLLPLHEQGKTVMVEFTADWCPNCKYVEQTVLKREAFQQKLQETGTELIIADWTHNDPAITEMLNKLDSKSIPFTAIFPGNNYLQPYVLRDIYRLDTALKALDAAQDE